MKNKELIELLQNYPEDDNVFVPSDYYEGEVRNVIGVDKCDDYKGFLIIKLKNNYESEKEVS